MTVEEAWDALRDMGTSEETLQTVTDINGYSVEVLEDILFAQYGERSFEEEEE